MMKPSRPARTAPRWLPLALLSLAVGAGLNAVVPDVGAAPATPNYAGGYAKARAPRVRPVAY